MAGTGLPTGGNGRPVLLQPSPEVRPVAALAEADAWGLTAAAAGRTSDKLLGIAAQAQEQEKLKWAADFEVAARTKRIELQGQYPDNPEAFKKDWQSYTDGALKGVPLAYADHARKTLGMEGLSSLASIQGAAIAKTRALTADSVKARLDAAQTDVLGYAYRGDMNNERFVQAKADYQSFLNEGVKTGLWSQDRADMMADELSGKAKAEFIVGQAKSFFDAKGPEAAYREAETLLNSPDLPLTPAERESYRGRVSAEIGKWSGFQNADRQKIAVEADAMKDRFKVGTATREEVDGLVQRALTVRDYRTAAALRQGFASQELLGNEAWKPPAATDQTIRAMKDLARSTPPSAPLADRIVGAESGGRADATNPNSSATGAGQFIASTWLDMVKRNAPDIAAGKSDAALLALRTDPALSKRMVEAYAAENRDKLAAQGLPTDDGALYLAHFAGPAGAAAALKADPATPIRDILDPAAIQANAGMKAGGKPFADWTAGDLRAWATSKVGQTAKPAVDPGLIQDLEAANAKKMEALKSDPLGYVSGLRDAPKLPAVDWSQPDAAAQALQERQRTAVATSSMFQTGTVPVLTKPELEELKAKWTGSVGTPAVRAQIVGTLARALDGEHLRATLEKVADEAPLMAAAGMIYREASPELATAIIRGQGYIDADKKILPPEKNMRQEMNDYLGHAAPGAQTRAAIFQAAQARYADMSRAANDFSGAYDSDRMKKAVAEVSGGVVKWSGSSMYVKSREVIPPKPYMTSDDFGKIVSTLTDADFQDAVSSGDKPFKAADFQKHAWLEDVAPGRYTVWMSDGAVKRPDGSPFVLDLRGKEPPKMVSAYTPSGGTPQAYVTGGAAATYR